MLDWMSGLLTSNLTAIAQKTLLMEEYHIVEGELLLQEQAGGSDGSDADNVRGNQVSRFSP